MADERLAAAYGQAEALVREADRDRWLAALFLPEDARRHVYAVTAFSLEIARVREIVREALPGEIRMQWWVDAIQGEARGDVAGHPIAAALIDTIRRFSLSRQTFVNLVEARQFDLYDDAMPSLTDLEGYAGETASVLFQTACLILNGGNDPRTADAAGHAGVAYALVGLMRALPIHARRGQVYLPADVLARHGASAEDVREGKDGPAIRGVLAEMREHVRHHLARAEGALRTVEPRFRPAFAGLALLPGYLRLLERSEPFGAPVEMAHWTKPARLWLWIRRFGAN